MSNVLNNARLRLVLRGQARLERQGSPIELRRKGLAVLGYLGVAGAASRSRLAELLWDSGNGRLNLRVELHRLAEAVGVPLFASGADPLRLPEWLEVEREDREGELLGGLDGISDAMDTWLDAQRSHEDQDTFQNRRASDVASRLARELRSPFVVVMRARPGEELDDFTMGLAKSLRVPVVEGCGSPARALHVVVPPYPSDLVQAVVDAREGAFLVRVPAYGEDPRPVLELRNAYDPARLRYVELPRLSWEDARGGLLRELPFGAAAAAYMWTGGNAGFLRELARMRWAREDDGSLVIPQRIRAAYQLEIRHASLEARLALERLSVHPGPITESLVDVLEAREALDELERRGWLVYDGTWRFREAESRTIIYRSLQPGRRASYHRDVALQMAIEGSWLAEVYHRIAAGQPVAWSDAGGTPRGLARDAVRASLGLEVRGPSARAEPTAVGSEKALLESGWYGEGVTGDGADWRFIMLPGSGPSSVSFEAPEGPFLLRLRGCCRLLTPLGVGLSGTAVPLEVELADSTRVVFLEGLPEPVARDGVVLVPLTDSIDTWLKVPATSGFTVASRAETALLELEITVHAIGRSQAVQGRNGSAGVAVTAIDVGEADVSRRASRQPSLELPRMA